MLVGCVLPAPNSHLANTAPSSPTEVLTLPGDYPDPTANTPNPAEGSLLSDAIYFLKPDSNGISQIWRLAPDGSVLSQITTTPFGVKDYDIAMNGNLAFVTGGELYIQTPNNQKPELWIGISGAQPENYPNSPRWSSDGRLLAYAVNRGIWIGRTPNTVHLTISDASLTDIPENMPRIRPYSWSPDGKWLIVTVDRDNSSEIALMDPSNDVLRFLKLTDNLPACCQAVWAPESQGILVSNPFASSLNQNSPGGLWWIPNNGQAKALIPSQATDGTFNFVGWPYLTVAGDIIYAFSNFPMIPTARYPMMIYKSSLATPELREPLRDEPYFIEQILWEKDGKQAILVIPGPGNPRSSGGPLVVVSLGEFSARPLVDQANNPRWGP